jgi:hypothetical protein
VQLQHCQCLGSWEAELLRSLSRRKDLRLQLLEVWGRQTTAVRPPWDLLGSIPGIICYGKKRKDRIGQREKMSCNVAQVWAYSSRTPIWDGLSQKGKKLPLLVHYDFLHMEYIGKCWEIICVMFINRWNQGLNLSTPIWISHWLCTSLGNKHGSGLGECLHQQYSQGGLTAVVCLPHTSRCWSHKSFLLERDLSSSSQHLWKLTTYMNLNKLSTLFI